MNNMKSETHTVKHELTRRRLWTNVVVAAITDGKSPGIAASRANDVLKEFDKTFREHQFIK